jgi:hypothetical protein
MLLGGGPEWPASEEHRVVRLGRVPPGCDSGKPGSRGCYSSSPGAELSGERSDLDSESQEVRGSNPLSSTKSSGNQAFFVARSGRMSAWMRSRRSGHLLGRWFFRLQDMPIPACRRRPSARSTDAGEAQNVVAMLRESRPGRVGADHGEAEGGGGTALAVVLASNKPRLLAEWRRSRTSYACLRTESPESTILGGRGWPPEPVRADPHGRHGDRDPGSQDGQLHLVEEVSPLAHEDAAKIRDPDTGPDVRGDSVGAGDPLPAVLPTDVVNAAGWRRFPSELCGRCRL